MEFIQGLLAGIVALGTLYIAIKKLPLQKKDLALETSQRAMETSQQAMSISDGLIDTLTERLEGLEKQVLIDRGNVSVLRAENRELRQILSHGGRVIHSALDCDSLKQFYNSRQTKQYLTDIVEFLR